MTESSILSSNNSSAPSKVPSKSCTLHVCISCRIARGTNESLGSRAGLNFYQQLRDAIDDSHLKDQVDLRPTECLSICPRPCGLALSSPGAWSYLFGDQKPNQTINDVMQCLSLYIESTDGFLPRSQRPQSMRSSILGRIPPARGDN